MKIENLTPIFLFSTNLFFLLRYHDLLVINRKKVLSSQNVLLWIFLQIRYLIWRYAEFNRLLVGSRLIPLNIRLQQDNWTVCFVHTAVASESLYFVCIFIIFWCCAFLMLCEASLSYGHLLKLLNASCCVLTPPDKFFYCFLYKIATTSK